MGLIPHSPPKPPSTNGLAKGRLQLYTAFHLNICYSSIEESQRREVIRRCYWPLLRLAQKHGLPLGIELPAYTLETIARLDPAWLKALRELVTAGGCELIGSGYAQLIGPLVPAEVNAANLRLGRHVYERLLGVRPRVALINEQAYSAGLVPHYLTASYEAIIMEWDNPAQAHPEWDPAWRYLPQRALGPSDERIGLIWNKSIAFQKFQRYTHGELELDEYLSYLLAQRGEMTRAFPLYANDVEVFDFRPGRYHTEAPICKAGEWPRIDKLFEALLAEPTVEFIRPSRVLDLLGAPGSGNKLRLESADLPVPVKKQGKYNVVRWAVTGRDDLDINTACWRLYRTLADRSTASDDDWRELCYLWSSDFRTHITDARWKAYRRRLTAALRRMKVPKATLRAAPTATIKRGCLPRGAEREGRYLALKTSHLRVRLNCQRGLTLDGVWLKGAQGAPLVGTLQHGFYDRISMGADWYSGHMTLETPGGPKFTDLCPVEPLVERLGPSGGWRAHVRIPSPFGPIYKTIEIPGDDARVDLIYRFDWTCMPIGSLRLGNFTLHPSSFDRRRLYFSVCNGGTEPDRFPLGGKSVDHGSPVSFLVSSSCAVGMTDGRFELGDGRARLTVESDPCSAALVGLLTYKEIHDTYFCRFSLSAGEIDDTRRAARGSKDLECRLTLRLQ